MSTPVEGDFQVKSWNLGRDVSSRNGLNDRGPIPGAKEGRAGITILTIDKPSMERLELLRWLGGYVDELRNM